MPRKLRVDYEGAIHHVTCRLVGSWREGDRQLFRDDRDRLRFLESVEKRVSLYGVRVHQYVLMANHFHLVIETPQANCSAFMQSLLTSYTGHFNLRHGRHGHLFDGRYKARLVQGDDYLLALSRYVHLNPVRVSELPDVEQRRNLLDAYNWSSYLQYIGRREKLPFVTFAPTLALLPGRNAVRRYRQYVEQGLTKGMEEWNLGEYSPLSIGDGGFREWVQDRYAELVLAANCEEDVAFRPTEKTLAPDAILAELAKRMECETSAFRSRAHGEPYRPFAAYFLTRFGGLSRRQTALHLGVRSGPAVSRQLSRYGELMQENRRLRKLAAACEDVFGKETREP
jgi:putative transposase